MDLHFVGIELGAEVAEGRLGVLDRDLAGPETVGELTFPRPDPSKFRAHPTQVLGQA